MSTRGATPSRVALLPGPRDSAPRDKQGEGAASLDMVLRELVRQRALEAGEVVLEVREDALTVVERKRLPCEPTMLDSMAEDRAPENDAAFLDERLQVPEDSRLRLERAGKAVEKTIQPDGAEAG